MFYARCETTPTVNVDGTLSCDSWTIVSEQELLTAIPIQQLFQLLDAAFSTPDAASISAAYMAGISVPLICYLTAYCYGMVVNMFK